MCDRRLATALIAATFLTGCAGNNAPDDWLQEPEEAPREAFGGWASVECGRAVRDRGCREVSGELIAVTADTIYILTDSAFLPIANDDFSRLVVTGYDSNASALAFWGLGGFLASASHGLFAIISAPVWLLTTSITAPAQSHIPQETYPPESLDRIRKYARFPQGLPAGLNREDIRPKPSTEGG